MNGKIQPQAIEMEQAILGACMLEKQAFQNIENILSSEVFYKDAHQIIYKHIEKLNDKAEPIDILSVTNSLKEANELEGIGGAYYITQLTQNIASSANIEYHSRVVYERYMQREVIRKSMEIAETAYDDFDEMMMHYSVFTDHIDSLYSGESNIKTLKEIAYIHGKALQNRIEQYKQGGMIGYR